MEINHTHTSTRSTMRNGSGDDARFAVKYDVRFSVTLPEDELLQLTSSSKERTRSEGRMFSLLYYTETETKDKIKNSLVNFEKKNLTQYVTSQCHPGYNS